MRILKVALAFFLIGFLAGNFDAAASLGHLEQSRVLQNRQLEASIARSSAGAIATIVPSALPPDLQEQALSLPAEVAAAATAALAEPPQELRRAEPIRSTLFLPPEPDWWALAEDARGPDGAIRIVFGSRWLQSERDRRPLSEMPAAPSMSLASPEAFAPERDKRAREDQRAFRQEFIMPFERGRVTSLFHQGRYHPAIDLAGRLGSPVHATTHRQKVTFTGWRRGYGYTVMTRDEAGRTHLYAHLQRATARAGSMLDQGQMLGTLGSTGRSTGPHVHYEVRTRAGRHIDPVTLLFPSRRVGRGLAWNGSRSMTRVASARTQPLPR